jgi:hypothetical protein
MITIFLVVGDFFLKCLLSVEPSSISFCVQTSPSYFQALFMGGTLELLFESIGIVRLYKKKGD